MKSINYGRLTVRTLGHQIMKKRLLIGAAATLLLIPELIWSQGPDGGQRQGPPRGGFPQGPPGGGFPQGPPGGGFGPGQDGGGFRQRGGGRGGFGRDPGQMFDRFANGKDVWTRADTNPWTQGMFDQIIQSLNISNGQITREQFTTYMQQQGNNWGGMGAGRRGNWQGGGGPPGRGGSPGNAPSPGGGGNGPGNSGNAPDQWAERMFQRYDTNGDGLLNKDEMPEALRAEVDKWDTNKDGFIDLTEFKAYFQADFQRRMAENGGWNPNWQGGGMGDPIMPPTPIEEEEIKKPTVYRAGNLPKDIPSWFAQYDTDGDGQIGLYEWKATGESLDKFRQIDRNNDGFITIDEAMRWQAEQNKNGGGASPSIGGNRFANQGLGNFPRPGGGFGGFQARGGGGGQGRDFGGRQGGGRNRNWPGGG
jgi:Ca2+-binding EF-hand superfamily protein